MSPNWMPPSLGCGAHEATLNRIQRATADRGSTTQVERAIREVARHRSACRPSEDRTDSPDCLGTPLLSR